MFKIIKIMNMKNIISLMMIGALVVATFSCSEESFDDKYVDPNKVTTVSIPNLMVGVFRAEQQYSTFGYYRGLGMDGTFMGKFAQTFGFGFNDEAWYPGFDAYTEGQMERFNNALRQYVFMYDMYEKLPESEKANYTAFIQAARVHLYQWALDVVDMHGDIPFSDACRLPIEMDITISYAKYDAADAIYAQVLGELKTAAEFFSNPASVKLAKFNTQDYVCRGDFAQWARYANSIRLRYALRVSQFGPLAETGKAILKEIIENPAVYPVVLTNDNNVFLKNDHSDQLDFQPSGFDWVTCRMASGPLIDRMLAAGNATSYKGGTGAFNNATDDPRLKILYSMRSATGPKDGLQGYFYYDLATVPDLVFNGMDVANKTPVSGYYVDVGRSEIVQGGLLWENRNYEHVQITASEVNFIIAEAYQRGWGVAKNEAKAEAAFKAGVTESIKWYYHLNETSEKQKVGSVATPSDAAIAAYAAARWTSAVNPRFPYSFELEGTSETDEKLAAILTQQWVDWGTFNSRQAWAQIRRTGIPKLVYPTTPGGISQWAPERWRYPQTEVNYNPNYSSVRDKDKLDAILFWANPKGTRHSTGSGAAWTDNWN
jgi:hypothetical protein